MPLNVAKNFKIEELPCSVSDILEWFASLNCLILGWNSGAALQPPSASPSRGALGRVWVVSWSAGCQALPPMPKAGICASHLERVILRAGLDKLQILSTAQAPAQAAPENAS
jgi:hypothetical protein